MTFQKDFLENLVNRQIAVTIFLLNGVKLQGCLIECDDTALLLKRENMVQLVYKHAVSTIMPVKPI